MSAQGGAAIIAMPSGAHFGNCRASAALNEPLRSEPAIVITFILSAIFKSSNSPGTRQAALPTTGSTGWRPSELQARLAGKAGSVEALGSPCYWPRQIAGGRQNGQQHATHRLDRNGPH